MILFFVASSLTLISDIEEWDISLELIATRDIGNGLIWATGEDPMEDSHCLWSRRWYRIDLCEETLSITRDMDHHHIVLIGDLLLFEHDPCDLYTSYGECTIRREDLDMDTRYILSKEWHQIPKSVWEDENRTRMTIDLYQSIGIQMIRMSM
jgi:hypothetical protein